MVKRYNMTITTRFPEQLKLVEFTLAESPDGCVVFYSDYAALQVRNARFVEWLREHVGCAGCGDMIECENRGDSDDPCGNWTLPAGLEVKP